MKDTSISLFKLVESMKSQGLNEFSQKLTVKNMFYMPSALEFTYIEPPFSIQYKSDESSDRFENVDIVLIAATGATGKSALSKYLAHTLKQPIFDMGAAGPVGENSLLGMMNKNMVIQETLSYIQDLKEGHAAMIIDALDEGLLKVTNQAFESFLDEVVSLSKNAQGIPFVLTGRIHVMENVALELEQKGLRVLLLQIEPFTIVKAREFIDNSMVRKNEQERYQEMYIKVRDLILTSVEGFFRDINEMKNKQYERFIGYAPVLQTIATLLDEKCNFQLLYQELERKDVRNIELVIDIIERIMWREQQKVEDELLPQITQNINPNTIETIQGKVYDISEQCVRLMYKIIGIEPEYSICDDVVFNERYSLKIEQWLNEHPFFSKCSNSFVNMVFETYVIARLLHMPEYKDSALLYLQDVRYKTSYLLFDFFNTFAIRNVDKMDLDINIVPYLYDSLSAMDTKNDRASMEIIGEDEGQVEISFFRKDEEYQYYIAKNDKITLPRMCANLTIDAPLQINIPSCTRVDMKAPIFINCNQIVFLADEIGLYSSEQEKNIIWEVNKLDVTLSRGGNPQIIDFISSSESAFRIITTDSLMYPFSKYQVSDKEESGEYNINTEYYHKLRRTLLLFRSHSKGELARIKDKIDNCIGNSTVGKAIVSTLLSTGVMFEKGIMYFLDYDRLAEVLGVKYDNVQSSMKNKKVSEFLQLAEKNITNKCKE